MRFSLTERQRFKQQAERVLHVPGNYTGGILEMALVLDMRIPEAELKETAAELSKTLKQHSEVFRNVRLNLAEWRPGEKLTSRVVPMPMLQMGSFLEDGSSPARGDVPEREALLADVLFGYLKLFQARSKLILIVTAGGVQIREEEACQKALKPFLGRKLIWMAGDPEPVMEPFLQKERCGYLNLCQEEEK